MSLHHPFTTYNDTLQVHQCLASMYVLRSTSIAILLPSSICVLYLGFQRWSKQSSSAAIMSHSDFFTYNMAVTDLIGVLGNIMNICATYFGFKKLQLVTFYTLACLWSGRMLFPTLTCWDRYLAVVHPIKYRRMRQRFGIRVRNICTICVWLQGFFGTVLFVKLIQELGYMFIASSIQVLFYLISMLFCSLSVLSVLIRPRPGEMGGDRMCIHQSKKRAFHTILIIMGALFLRFGGSFVCSMMIYSAPPKLTCAITDAQEWLSLPSSLVLTLLFLRQEGKLPGCKH